MSLTRQVGLAIACFVLGATAGGGGECTAGDCENGVGTFEYTSGGLYDGEWSDGYRHGQGRSEGAPGH
jgi:hypothetical protein